MVFFNSCQTRVIDSIVDAIEKYGTLELMQEGERLWVALAELPEAQSLFAIDESGRPVGIAIFMRPDLEHVVVLHIGIGAEFASGGPRAHEQLLLKILRELRRSCRRLKGVRRIELFYQHQARAEEPRSDLRTMGLRRRRQSGVAMRRIT